MFVLFICYEFLLGLGIGLSVILLPLVAGILVIVLGDLLHCCRFLHFLGAVEPICKPVLSPMACLPVLRILLFLVALPLGSVCLFSSWSCMFCQCCFAVDGILWVLLLSL